LDVHLHELCFARLQHLNVVDLCAFSHVCQVEL
jgi:hypothetical protein